MAIAYLTPSTAASFDITLPNNGAVQNVTFDGGSGSDRFLVAACGYRQGSAHTIDAMTFNAISMTAFGAAVIATQCYQRMFYLVNPASGSQTLGVDPAGTLGTSPAVVSAMVFSGVDQTTPFDGYTTANGADTSVELDVTSASGDMAFLMFTARTSGGTSSAPTSSSYTERYDNVGSDGQATCGGGEAAGAATVQFRASITASISVTSWVAMGANMNAASAGSEDHEGGSDAQVEVEAAGGGTKAGSGGGTATVNIAADGAGAKASSGGANAAVSVAAAGAGTKTASGGSTASVSVSAQGAGSKSASGGSDANVEIEATGGGTAAQAGSGGSTATVNVAATGAGTKNAQGGSTATVSVTATGGGSAARTGGSTATVQVGATGGGQNPETPAYINFIVRTAYITRYAPATAHIQRSIEAEARITRSAAARVTIARTQTEEAQI